MNCTGTGGSILERQETKCPTFLRLDASFSSSLALNHPEVRQTGVPRPRYALGELASDVEVDEVAIRKEAVLSSIAPYLEPMHRRPGISTVLAGFELSFERMEQFSTQQRQAYDVAAWEHRQQMVEETR